MGGPRGELGRGPGEGQVEVTLTVGFRMGKLRGDPGQWERVMGNCRAS